MFFQGLRDRGRHGVDGVISDDHRGLVNAVQRPCQGATWQRCQTHTMRNILDATPKAHRARLHADVRAIFEAPDPAKARTLLDAVLTEWADRAPQAAKVLEGAFEATTAILVLPERYRQRLRTTNAQERLNEEIRRRERVIRIFPNRDSVIRLLGALLLEIHEKWKTGTRYLDSAPAPDRVGEPPATVGAAGHGGGLGARERRRDRWHQGPGVGLQTSGPA